MNSPEAASSDSGNASEENLPPGADAKTPLGLPGRAWWRILKRVMVMSGFHELGLLAGGLAFYIFLALTPLIGATVMIYGLVGDVSTVRAQMQMLTKAVPPEVAGLIEEQLLQLISTNSGVTGLALFIALGFALFGGNRAASGMISALNVINEERETRNLIKLTFRRLVMTLAGILLAVIGVAGGVVFAWLQNQTSIYLGESTAFLFKVLTWVAAICVGSAGFAMIMRFGPDRRPAKWRWLTPGSLLATVLWLVISFGFSLYVAYVSNYNATYGSLSAIVVFLMWLYLSAYGVLLGALFNAEIERQTFTDTTAGPDRPPGKRGAVLADILDDRVPSVRDLSRKRQRRADDARHEAD